MIEPKNPTITRLWGVQKHLLGLLKFSIWGFEKDFNFFNCFLKCMMNTEKGVTLCA